MLTIIFIRLTISIAGEGCLEKREDSEQTNAAERQFR